MKRPRDEQVKILERVATLENVPKDVLHHILLTQGLNVREINAFCNSSKILKERCRSEELWEKIYLKYVEGANAATWRAGVEHMPNPFLRFMAYFAIRDEYYRPQFESPSKAEAIIIFDAYDEYTVATYYKMPEGFQAAWEQKYLAEKSENSDAGSDENDEEDADMAFNQEFGDNSGHVWEYVRYKYSDRPVGEEILQLINMGVLKEDLTLAVPIERVFYSLIALGWEPVYHPEYPTISCSVCNVNVASSMCNQCNAPICSNACLVDRHYC